MNGSACTSAESRPARQAIDLARPVRDHYLIHCIFQGEGRFEASGKSYTLGAGQGFLIVPWQTTVYTADAVHPWIYRWMGFSGRDAAALLDTCGLSAEQPVCLPRYRSDGR